jgi:chromosomal replication initiation ATPase DnaA
MTELTRRCLSLSKSQREKLIKKLQESLNEREDDGSRFATLLKAATEICGQGILSSSRDFNLVMGRRMIAYQMRSEGYSFPSIGKMMVRHHASVIHMVRMMEDALHFQFNLEMEYWNKFQQKIKEYDIHSRTTQGS